MATGSPMYSGYSSPIRPSAARFRIRQNATSSGVSLLEARVNAVCAHQTSPCCARSPRAGRPNTSPLSAPRIRSRYWRPCGPAASARISSSCQPSTSVPARTAPQTRARGSTPPRTHGRRGQPIRRSCRRRRGSSPAGPLPARRSTASEAPAARSTRGREAAAASAPPACAGRLPVPVDDPAAGEVIRRELDVDPVAREDPDPVAAHLPGGIPERLLAVVERDLVHPVPERLDHLALQLDLLFLVLDEHLLPVRRGPDRAATPSSDVLAAVFGADEAVPLRIVEPLHGSGCHKFHLLTTHARTVGRREAAGTRSGFSGV